MQYSTQINPVSYLKSHTAEIIQDMSVNREPLLVTQNGEAKLVVLDVKSYEQREETLAMLKLIALSHQQIERGETRSADDVFTDLDNS